MINATKALDSAKAEAKLAKAGEELAEQQIKPDENSLKDLKKRLEKEQQEEEKALKNKEEEETNLERLKPKLSWAQVASAPDPKMVALTNALLEEKEAEEKAREAKDKADKFEKKMKKESEIVDNRINSKSSYYDSDSKQKEKDLNNVNSLRQKFSQLQKESNILAKDAKTKADKVKNLKAS